MPNEELIGLQNKIADLTEAGAVTQILVQKISTTLTNTSKSLAIVPTILLSESGGGDTYPADRYYANLGLALSSGFLTTIAGASGLTHIYNQWDSGIKKFYLTLDASARIGAGSVRTMHFLGVGGQSSSYAPKNTTVTTLKFRCTARFPTNADYTVFGIGGVSSASATDFSNTADHFFQILRNAGAWELGTCDGSTISQSSGGTGDGNFHEFEVQWVAASITLYVDGVLTITKTTNMPAEPLRLLAGNNADNIDIVDVEWEWA